MTSRRNFVKRIGAGFLVMGTVPEVYASSLQEQEQASGLAPYLQNPASDGMTVMWRTTDPSYGYIEYGTDTDNLKIARSVEDGIVIANITRHKIRIAGLKPDTKYCYRVCTQKTIKYGSYPNVEFSPVEKSEFFSFTTLVSTPKDFTCLIFTDLHNNLTIYDKLMDQVQTQGIEFDFSIFNGDIFENPASESQALNLITRYNQRVNAANKPVIYLRGNHEIRGAYAFQLPTFFDLANGEIYFALTYGDTRFVFLDNGEDKRDFHVEYSGLVDFDSFRERQTEWLKEELTNDAFTGAFRKILVHHIPIYGWDNSWDPGFMPCFDLWDPIFRTAPFDLDITGHLHAPAFHTKNAVNNPFPLAVGGGVPEASSRVMVLIKKGDVLTLKMIDCSGNVSVFPIDTRKT